ncbi:hypothetical protein COOONC_03026 [Cooperia oncophora]
MQSSAPNVKRIHLLCVLLVTVWWRTGVHVVATDEIPNVVGLVVIDVVEGSAMDALAGMRTFLRGRPSSFESEEKAITWCLQSGATRNREAAKISMPAQIKKTEDWKGRRSYARIKSPAQTKHLFQYVWRIDLMDTEPYWVDSPNARQIPKYDSSKWAMAVQEDSPDRLADELARFALRYRFAEAAEGARPVAPHPMMGMGMMI